MRFLNDFPPDLRERLLAASTLQSVEPGTVLIRRGEQGGDLYLIESGSYEVVDTRSHPEIVVDIVPPGAVLGELTFVDDAPRGADVRAVDAGEVRVWHRAEVLDLFATNPALAAAFYRAVARTLSNRLRALSGTVAMGGFTSQRSAGSDEHHARELASRILDAWVTADELLRDDPYDKAAEGHIRSGLDMLLGEVSRWLLSVVDPEDRARAGTQLARELRPHLNRAVTGERTLDTHGQAAGDPRLLAHLIRGEGSGNGTFGHTLDRLLLSLPTFHAIRERARVLVAEGRTLLHPEEPSDLLFVHPNCGVVLVGLLLPMSAVGGRVRVIDSSRSVLGVVDAGLPRRPPRIEFIFFQADVAAIAMGRSDLTFDPHNVIILDGILDHLPDRLALTLLTWAAKHLRPGGHLLCSGLAPTEDELVVDHILGWPLVRREPDELARLVASTPGLEAELVTGEQPGVVIRATRQ